MEIETIKTVKQIEEKEILIKYTQKDIEKLIQKDLQDKGYNIKKITMVVGSKYVEDEWGMNRRLTSYFDRANVIVY